MGESGPPQFQKQEVSGSERAQWRVTPSEEQPVSLGHWTGLAATLGARGALGGLSWERCRPTLKTSLRLPS